VKRPATADAGALRRRGVICHYRIHPPERYGRARPFRLRVVNGFAGVVTELATNIHGKVARIASLTTVEAIC
jgi:hypothetical protein